MSYFDNFIFFDEVVRITFLFLFVYILLCIYFFPYFFKSCIFLAAFDNIQKFNLYLKILLQFKKLVSNIIKNLILNFITFSISLFTIKKTNKFYIEIIQYIFSFLRCIYFFIFFLFLLVVFCYFFTIPLLFVFRFTIYFLLFVSFIFFVKLAFYSLLKIIDIWWNNDFITFTKIVNGLMYGVLFSMYIFIFYVFGETGILLFLVGYFYVEKNILIIKRQKTEKYEQSLIALFASVVNFLTYNFLIGLCSKQLDIVVVFYCKIVVLFLLIISIYFFFIEFKKWYNVVDILAFCRNYPGYALTLGISTARMVSIVVVEVVCMRYGIAGGLLVMGGPGVILSGNCKPPSSEELSPEKLAELEKQLRNKSRVVEVPRPLEIVTSVLPETPSRKPDEFLNDVVQNLEAFKVLDIRDPLYIKYINQFDLHRKTDEFFRSMTHKSFDEFLSCIRPMIANSSDANGKVVALASPVEDKQVDYIVKDPDKEQDGIGIQTKRVTNFSDGNLQDNRENYEQLLADKNINFIVQTVYENIVRPRDMKICLQENSQFIKGQEALKKATFPQVTEKNTENFYQFAVDNHAKMKRTEVIMQKQSFLHIMTKAGTVAETVEVKVPKTPGCPSRCILQNRVIKTLCKK